MLTLDELEQWFSRVQYPDKVVLGAGVTVVDPALMVSSHIRMLRVHEGNRGYKPYHDRLLLVRQLLIDNYGVSPRLAENTEKNTDYGLEKEN